MINMGKRIRVGNEYTLTELFRIGLDIFSKFELLSDLEELEKLGFMFFNVNTFCYLKIKADINYITDKIIILEVELIDHRNEEGV